MRRYAPVIVLASVSVVLLAGLADLAWGIVFGLPVRLADATFGATLWNSRQLEVIRFMAVFTHLGDLAVSSAIVLVCCGALWTLKRHSSALFLFGVTASAALVNTGLKEVVDRTRPPAMMAVIQLPNSASFPSGHALIGLTLGGALAIILMFELGVARGVVPGVVLIAVGTLLGISRVYLGVHWWSDVLGGWILALAWLAAWSAGWIWLLVRSSGSPGARPGKVATTERATSSPHLI